MFYSALFAPHGGTNNNSTRCAQTQNRNDTYIALAIQSYSYKKAFNPCFVHLYNNTRPQHTQTETRNRTYPTYKMAWRDKFHVQSTTNRAMAGLLSRVNNTTIDIFPSCTLRRRHKPSQTMIEDQEHTNNRPVPGNKNTHTYTPKQKDETKITHVHVCTDRTTTVSRYPTQPTDLEGVFFQVLFFWSYEL